MQAQIEVNDQVYEVEFDYEPYDPGSRHEPLIQENVCILSVWKNSSPLNYSDYIKIEDALEAKAMKLIHAEQEIQAELKAQDLVEEF